MVVQRNILEKKKVVVDFLSLGGLDHVRGVYDKFLALIVGMGAGLHNFSFLNL